MKNIKAKIVVGLGYGDEGKGMTVSHLIKKSKDPIVIRFSGGQQAGHTVHIEDIKHICSNFGAGVLQGIPTYFSEHTTFYPVTIAREIEVLSRKGIKNPKLYLHPMAKITTPWDVYENEHCDANREHGTCGLGVGKTMARNKNNYTLTAIDLLHEETLKAKIKTIGELTNKGGKLPKQLAIDLEEFWEAIWTVRWEIRDNHFLLNYHTLIFEGSQGVLLDKDHGAFPNVTYANTTSKNAMEICDKLNIKKRHVYGVTRAYHTRHGNGYFHEDEIELKDTHHETNVNNEYQGEFKIARLDYELLDYATAIELIYSYGFKRTLMVTCCNQIYDEDEFFSAQLCFEWDKIKCSHSPYGEFKNY